MANLTGKVVLITGASSGIGEALAREYVAAGARVALLARRTDRLDALCQELNGGDVRAIALTADVAKDGDLEAAVARTVSELGRLDVVIANAGFGVMGHFTKLSLDDFRRQMETNVFGALRTARASVEELRKTRGSFAFVSSVMAYLPMPASSAYSMSKAALMSFSECLRVDMSPLGVSVTHVAPGFIATELRFAKEDGKIADGATDPVPTWLQMPAKTAARKIVRAVACRRRELILTNLGKLGVFFARHFYWLTAWVMAFGARRAGRRLGY
jgi:NAD(P)-dependent dehydrogenase (short-subunit alcohol dehydrogenase family)